MCIRNENRHIKIRRDDRKENKDIHHLHVLKTKNIIRFCVKSERGEIVRCSGTLHLDPMNLHLIMFYTKKNIINI